MVRLLQLVVAKGIFQNLNQSIQIHWECARTLLFGKADSCVQAYPLGCRYWALRIEL